VRAVLSPIGEVVGDGLECLVLAATCDVVELAVMDAVGVDLLVVEPDRADQTARWVCLSCLVA